jgi:hypothetical protein
MVVLLGAATMALGGMSVANASPPGQGSCSGGPVPGGTYASYSVTGDCYLAPDAHLVVRGNVTIARGAALDATRYSSSSLTVGGNVSAGRDAQFAMGCSDAHPCSDGLPKPAQDTVRGNVTLTQVFNAAINNAVIGGNLTSTGGGAGLIPQTGPESPFIPFSVKDDTIRGNVTVTGLRTVWFGIIRSQVGGNVTLVNDQGSDRDANEVVANQIGGNLVCVNNHPQAQFGDAAAPVSPGDYGWNHVRGNAVGECASLVSR